MFHISDELRWLVVSCWIPPSEFQQALRHPELRP